MTTFPRFDDAIRVQNEQEVLKAWLVLSAGGKRYFCKPNKVLCDLCKPHHQNPCYECWKHLAANEATCAALAVDVGLRELPCAWLTFENRPYFGIEFLGKHAKLRDYLRGEGGSTKKFRFINGRELAGQSLCFDLFVNNRDGTCANYVYAELTGGDAKLFSIDYDKALLGTTKHRDDWLEQMAPEYNVEQKCEKLLQFLGTDDSVARQAFEMTSAAVRALTKQDIDTAVNDVPKDWWPDSSSSGKLCEALLTRATSFNPEWSAEEATAKQSPCIWDNGRTCQSYTIPEMFLGRQFLASR